MLDSNLLFKIVGFLFISQIVFINAEEKSELDKYEKFNDLHRIKEYLKGVSTSQQDSNSEGNLDAASEANELMAEQNEIENALATAALYEKLLNQNEKSGEEEEETSVIKRSPFLRFGKRSPAFLRFGRSPYLRFGKRSPAFLRFGRSPAFLRFGRSVPENPIDKSQ